MSSAPLSQTDLPSGTMVGEYRLQEKIGEGGMGQVYRAQHPRIGKKAAVKILNAQFAQDPVIVQRLLEEARAVNQIRHPNIVDIFSFGELPDGRPYFVMEYLEGENLETALVREALSPAEIVPLLEQLCLALGAAHQAGFIHRDLKPENLWVVRIPNQPPSLKVLDFGIAKSMDDSAPSLTKTGQVLGTPYYMAPEQALGQGVDARTDIYAVGVVVYRIVAGALPFDDESANAVIVKHATQPAAPPSSHRKVPQKLDAVVLRCLAKEPSQRPQTAGDLWKDLRPALEEWAGVDAESPSLRRVIAHDLSIGRAPPVTGAEATILAPDSRMTVPPVGRPVHTTPKAGRRTWLVGVALAISAVAVAIGVIFVGGRQGVPLRSPVEPVVVPAEVVPQPVRDTPVAPNKVAAIPSTLEGRDAGASPSLPSSPPRRKPKHQSHEGPGPIRL